MTKLDFKDLTDDQLFQERKKVKTNHLLFSIGYAIILVIGILITFRRKVSGGEGMFFMFLPLAFGPIMLNLNKKNKAIKEEIKRREESNS